MRLPFSRLSTAGLLSRLSVAVVLLCHLIGIIIEFLDVKRLLLYAGNIMWLVFWQLRSKVMNQSAVT